MADRMPPRKKLKLRVQCQDGMISLATWWDEVRVMGKTVQLVKFPPGGERPQLPSNHPDHVDDGNTVQFIAKLNSDEDTSLLYTEVMQAIQYRRSYFSVAQWAEANDVSLRLDSRSAEVAATQAR